VSALLVGAVLALGAAGAAQAATSVSTIDSSQKGSITIHKYEQPVTATGLPNNGTQQTVTGLNPLAGVQFSVKQVDPATYDLTTNAGWSALKTLTATQAATLTAGYTTTVTTAADGSATAANLPLGVYLVTETVYPAGATPSAPFLITVPLTDPTNLDHWLYAVHVYPKNAITRGDKTVNDAASVKLGDTVSWTILADIPDLAVIDGYRIVDPLDAKLTYKATTVTLDDGTVLTAGTDYTLTSTGTPTTVTVDFTTTGLGKLATNNTKKVKVVIDTTVNTVGDIDNKAYVYPNKASFTITPGQPGGPTVTSDPITKWGNVSLKKVSTQNANTVLAGATFQVYATQADAQAGTNPISISGVSSWTTDASGVLTISGLRQSGWANGVAVTPTDPNYRNYWVVETKAPTGYSLLAEPVKVTVGAADNTVDFTIEDAPHNGGFTLPFTGSVISTSLFYGGGALLLAGIIVLIIRGRRKTNTTT
jgi:fimbrial isopeptide formation D2 family protein